MCECCSSRGARCPGTTELQAPTWAVLWLILTLLWFQFQEMYRQKDAFHLQIKICIFLWWPNWLKCSSDVIVESWWWANLLRTSDKCLKTLEAALLRNVWDETDEEEESVREREEITCCLDVFKITGWRTRRRKDDSAGSSSRSKKSIIFQTHSRTVYEREPRGDGCLTFCFVFVLSQR